MGGGIVIKAVLRPNWLTDLTGLGATRVHTAIALMGRQREPSPSVKALGAAVTMRLNFLEYSYL